MKTCIILNPTAGGGDDTPESDLERALERALERIPEAEVLASGSPGEARTLAARAVQEGFERVVAAGGDGTLNEVINGIAPDFPVEVGLIPLGTGNDLARTLGLPADPRAAVDLLLDGRARPIDVIRFSDGRSGWLINASAGGFSGEVGEHLNHEIKRRWGPLSYLRGAFEAVAELVPYEVRIELEGGPDGDGAGQGRERLDLDAVNVVVANGRSVAGGIPVAPDAQIDDGLADLVVIRPAAVSSLSVLASKALVGAHLEDPLVVHRRARRIHVRTEPAMPFNVDGERSGDTPVLYEVVPGAVRFVAPA